MKRGLPEDKDEVNKTIKKRGQRETKREGREDKIEVEERGNE